jgi:4-amino-4-deoxy-L-arabinose transferase-like glycosyltransferase
MKRFKPVLIFALLLGLFMRGWQAKERFLYAHDNDLAGWIVKDIVLDHHFRLIGQETSQKGIFIGPLFYYSLIPFYLVTNMDPIGSLGYSLIIGLVSVASLYIVVYRLYGSRGAVIASLIYAGSFLISQTEREIVPTTSVMLWSIWFFYCTDLVFRGEKSGLLLAAFLIGLVWNINLALVLLSPLILLGIAANHKKFVPRDFLKPVILLVILLVPLLLFEFRHNFIQTKSLLKTFSQISGKTAVSPSFLSAKVSHVLGYVYKNTTGIFLVGQSGLPEELIPWSLIIALAILLVYKKIPRYTGVIFVIWMGLYISFFTLSPLNLSEYYLNGMNIFWLIIAAVFMDGILPRQITVLLIGFLLFYNLNTLLTSPVNASGYIQKKAIIGFVREDAAARGYPCVAFSYITDPGYQFGYRYFIYLEGLKTAAPSSGAPVYTIVFPHSLVNGIDKSFGALGLILPDYQRYDSGTVKLACSGPDSNLTDPMFGFTK